MASCRLIATQQALLSKRTLSEKIPPTIKGHFGMLDPMTEINRLGVSPLGFRHCDMIAGTILHHSKPEATEEKCVWCTPQVRRYIKRQFHLNCIPFLFSRGYV